MKVFISLVLSIVGINLLVYFSSRIQVYMLYKMYSLGSGLDDGATELFVNNKQRYKQTVLDLLNAENPDSYKAQASFIFAELLLEDPDINQKVRIISESHQNKNIRCFWFDVLSGRFEQVKVAGEDGNNFAAYVIRDKGSKCE